MSFVPPRCPNPDCANHKQCESGSIIRWGYFDRSCLGVREQRYRCRKCRKTFSRQTFRHDYRDRRPDCNERVFEMLTSGVGLRQTARTLKICATTAQKKMRKMSRTCELLHENLSAKLPAARCYLMDEEESYEGASIRPLTVPILIEKENWFIVATSVGSIRRRAPEGTARRKRQDREEADHGRRPDQSRECVDEVLRALRRRTDGPIELLTDQKSSYATVASEVFGPDLVHSTTSSKAPRTTRNPLFPINSMIAMSRDNCGRLRRRSWLVSKLAKWLRGQMSIFTVYRNYVRRRFNKDAPDQTPAKLMGLLPRNLRPEEVLRWRQDWGAQSVHPMSLGGTRAVSDVALTGGSAM